MMTMLSSESCDIVVITVFVNMLSQNLAVYFSGNVVMIRNMYNMGMTQTQRDGE